MTVYVVTHCIGGIMYEPCVFTNREAALAEAQRLTTALEFNPDEDQVEVHEVSADVEDVVARYNPTCIWGGSEDSTQAMERDIAEGRGPI